ARPLLDHGEVPGGQPAGVERIADGDHPALVEIVEPIRADTRPVVDGHGTFLQGGPGEPVVTGEARWLRTEPGPAARKPARRTAGPPAAASRPASRTGPGARHRAAAARGGLRSPAGWWALPPPRPARR